MASIQDPNPLDKLAAYFKPCTRQFSQQDYYNMDDTLAELRESEQRNPLNNIDVFIQPFTKKFEKVDYYNDEIWVSNNEKIEIGNSIKIDKIKSTTSNKSSTKTSAKRRRVDSFDDENKYLPSLSATTTSDTSSSESSEDEEDDESFPSTDHVQSFSQDGDNVDSTSAKEMQFDDNIIENLETLFLNSDNLKTARKIAKPRSKKQVVVPDEGPNRPTTEERDEKSRLLAAQPENVECKEEGDEILRTTIKKIGGRKGDQKKIPKKNGASRAGFTGSWAHNKYLDILDNQAFKARHQKIITKKVQETNLSDGLSSLLSGGFKPTNMLDQM